MSIRDIKSHIANQFQLILKKITGDKESRELSNNQEIVNLAIESAFNISSASDETLELVGALLAKLENKDHMQVIDLYFMQQRTQEEVALELKKSQKWVSNKIKEALEVMRK